MTESRKESGRRTGSASPAGKLFPDRQSVLLTVGGIIALVVLAVWFTYFVTRNEEGVNKARAGIVAAVDDADALYQRALGLLSTPVHEDSVSGRVGPFVKDGDPVVTRETIRLRAPNAVNPQAETALTQAKTILQAALADNSLAPADIKALAHHMAARVMSLRGYCFDQKALNQRWNAQRDANRVDRTLGVVQAQLGFLAQYDKLLSLPDDDVQKIVDQTTTELADIEKEHEAASKQIIYLGNEVAALRDQIATLSQKARQNRAESRLITGAKSLAMIEDVLKDEAQIRQIEGKISTNQNQVQQLLEQRRMLGVRINAGRSKIEMAKSMLEHRKEQMGRRGQQREDCLKLIKESQDAILKDVAAVNAAALGAKADEAQAMKEYSNCQAELGHALVGPDANTAEGLAEKGDVLARIAGLQSEQAIFARRLLALQAPINDVWPKAAANATAPKEAQELAAYLSNPDVTAGESLKNYEETIRDYELAIQGLKENEKVYRWIYQGELAAAYLGHYRLKNDAEKLRKANEIIADAMKSREASPYLRPVLHLRDRLAGIAATQPAASEPAAPPASPEAPAVTPPQTPPPAAPQP
ncbi:MAG: hypothetical protein LLG01_18210 [Planctomycetaceae bacterium]|nr:hypothetical protein [Planctomycetaceae bacterium]